MVWRFFLTLSYKGHWILLTAGGAGVFDTAACRSKIWVQNLELDEISEDENLIDVEISPRLDSKKNA